MPVKSRSGSASGSSSAAGVRPQTRQFLQNLHDSLAFVLGRHLDILAWNHLATVAYKDFAAISSSGPIHEILLN